MGPHIEVKKRGFGVVLCWNPSTWDCWHGMAADVGSPLRTPKRRRDLRDMNCPTELVRDAGMCVCAYVCVRVYHTHTYIHTFIDLVTSHTCTRIYVYMYVCVYTHKHVCEDICGFQSDSVGTVGA